ncbi:hypothetical protein Q31a_43330 [Aureliella helgolandensis]|uniref:Uncharacterized protein n=1 Tax=Aureliella helgolandensis TaxID=2527968 RepID=A0A518GBM5_9BACT|nr:hypothetical protein Q31a_43330 [Aureliella helgolandensis]
MGGARLVTHDKPLLGINRPLVANFVHFNLCELVASRTVSS